jgi:hypothetical protein
MPGIGGKIMNDTSRRPTVAFALVIVFVPLYAQQPRPLSPPLKNWAAPLYWAPTPAEFEQQRVFQSIGQRIAHPDVPSSAIAQASNTFAFPGPMTFIAMTPCRVMDTRSSQPFTGPFGPPSLPAYGTARQVPMSSSSCNIPVNAGAYSLNVTVVPQGPLSFLTVWPAGQPYPTVSTLNDPVSGGVIANAAIVVAGSFGDIQMVAGNPTDVIIDINGYYAAPTDGSRNTPIGIGALQNNIGNENTATGFDALQSNTVGDGNTANGVFALFSNTSGGNNTASGVQALGGNTTGGQNTAVGALALSANTTGTGNTASGYSALYFNTTGAGNTASGTGALQSNTTGIENVASGAQALQSNTTGNNNIAIGHQAAYNVSAGNSNNIHIGNLGLAGDGAAANSGVIRIGTAGTQTSFFMAGVSGVPTGLGGPVPVLIDANGQLGTMSSSQRFKEDIQDMGDSSSGLMRLRPVTFRYKEPYTDGSKPIDYGLIAEEVADVYPDLVAYSPSGEVQTVQYQKVNAMLLNEVQKQHQQIQEQQEEMSELKARLAKLERQPEKRRKK